MKLRLQYRYALTILPLIAAVSAVFLGVSLYQIRHQAADTHLSSTRIMDVALSRRLESEGRSRATLLADSLINDIYNSDLNGIYQTIGATRDQENISYVYVFDPRGQILHDGTEDNPSFGTSVKDPRALGVFDSDGPVAWVDGNFNAVAPISLGSNVLGAVWLGMSTKPITLDLAFLNTELDGMLRRQVWQYFNVAVGVSLLVIALSTVIVMGLARTLSRPIEVISQVTARIGKGHYDAEIPIRRSDEIGTLAESVTRMAQELKHTTTRMAQELNHTTVSKMYLDGIIETMLDTLVVLNPDGTIKTVNKAACELLGYQPHELIGQPVQTIMKRNAATNGAADIADLTEPASSIGIEDVFVAKDGREISVEVAGAVMHDADGNRDCVVYAARDITERKKAEEEIAEKSSLLETTFESMSQGISVYDADLKLRAFNQRYVDLWRFPSGFIRLGMPFEEIARFNAERGDYGTGDIETLVKTSVAAMRQAKPLQSEFTTPDGTVFVLWRAPMHGGGIINTFTDITEQERAKTEMLRAKEQAELANRTKSEFLANMSHELRTPLNAILGFSELMGNATLGPLGNPKYQEYTKDINDSGRHLLALIDDILDLSKIEADQLDLDEEDIDVAMTIGSCMVLVKERARNGGVRLKTDLPDGLPALRADKRKLKQILVNLLSNAVKFTPAGGEVTLKTWWRPESGYVFQVIDTGIGIALEDIPTALSPFGQVDGQLDRKYEGTGLGLPLTKSLAEMHGGSLDLQSEVGVGTTVTIRFPAERIFVGKAATEIAEPAEAEDGGERGRARDSVKNS